MNPNEILTEDQVARGLYIEEDDHFVYLKHCDEVIGRWWYWAARLVAIRNAARSWVKKHGKEKIPS